ncbi:MAG: hypothetical protein KDI30_12125 [Pseudomonadales bacterium]|nr:hypothetical protein [Pseudomonadales bacterium]
MPVFPRNIDELSVPLLNTLLQVQQPQARLKNFTIAETLQCGDGLASTADRAILELEFESGKTRV